MTEAMWAMYRNYLEEYGSGGPEHYSWTEYSQKSKDLIRAKLFGSGGARDMTIWRSTHKQPYVWAPGSGTDTVQAGTLLHGWLGPGTGLVIWGVGQFYAGLGLVALGLGAGIAGVVSIPVTAGLGAGLEMPAGAAIWGGIHLIAAGGICFYAGGVDMGWWGR